MKNMKYEVHVPKVTRQQLWSAWTDVNKWPKWDHELEMTELQVPFEQGAEFKLRPKGGPTVRITVTECTPLASFTDVTHFLLAKMMDRHEFIETNDGVTIRNEIWVTGPLAFVWRKLVAENVAKGRPLQILIMILYIRNENSQNKI